jgi:hypothetical protein
MTGRRRYPRFALAAPLSGSLHVREEVAIEVWREGEIEVTSMAPCQVNERLALEMPGDGDGLIPVTVRESRPIVAEDGSIQYRLVLAFDPSAVATTSDEGHRQS